MNFSLTTYREQKFSIDPEALDEELSLGPTEEIFEITEEQSPITPELVARKLDAIKSHILTSLRTNTYLSPLHAKLATLVISTKNLDVLYSYHPQFELSLEIKMQIRQAISQWYDVYLQSEYGNDIPTGIEKREYPLAVLLPVVTQLVFPAEVIQVK